MPPSSERSDRDLLREWKGKGTIDDTVSLAFETISPPPFREILVLTKTSPMGMIGSGQCLGVIIPDGFERVEVEDPVVEAILIHQQITRQMPLSTILDLLRVRLFPCIAPGEMVRIDFPVLPVLDLARIEEGLCQTRPVAMNPCRVVEEVVHGFDEEARQRGNRVEALGDAAIGTVMADPSRLRQIFLNLLIHANRLTEQGEIVARVQLLEGDAQRRRIHFSLEDTGLGIPPERRQRVFEPFVLGGEPATEGSCGTGLGLSLCKTLVESMGGTLQVESLPQEGSCFEFTLVCPTATRLEESGDRVVSSVRSASRVILLIEDEPVSRALLTELLVDDGHRVVTPAHGQDPLALLSSQEVDLLLTDLRLPDRDGVEIIRMVRALPDAKRATMPIVVLTADAAPERLRAALEAGAGALMTKPMNLNRLRYALANPWSGALLDTLPNPEEGTTRSDNPVIDAGILERMRRSIGEDRFAEICEKFRQVEAQTRQEMEIAWAGRDHVRLSHHAHRISGSAAHLGMASLSALAEALADEARHTLPDRCEQRVEALLQAMRAAREALACHYRGPGANGPWSGPGAKPMGF
ncbi:MAG: response regulator [Magnetococcales bacterium]|nr:response regulator [Magnetococcales bacterium]